jgi:hypothetical protein
MDHLTGIVGTTTAEATARLAGRMQAAVPGGAGSFLDQGPYATAAGITSPLLATVCLLVIIFGPAPRLGTRWYWFWAALMPWGLGVLLWLAREHPWSARAGAVPGP